MFFPEPNSRLSKRLLKFNRQELTYLVSAITGHNYLRNHSNKIAPLSSIKCRLCDSDNETFYHLTNECTELITYQAELFNNRKFEGKNTRWNPVRLLDFLNLPQVKKLFTSPYE